MARVNPDLRVEQACQQLDPINQARAGPVEQASLDDENSS